jgi:hypothetical protein
MGKLKLSLLTRGGTPIRNAYVTATSSGCGAVSRYTDINGIVDLNVPFGDTLKAHISAVKPGPLIPRKCHLVGSRDVTPNITEIYIWVIPKPEGCPMDLLYY